MSDKTISRRAMLLRMGLLAGAFRHHVGRGPRLGRIGCQRPVGPRARFGTVGARAGTGPVGARARIACQPSVALMRRRPDGRGRRRVMPAALSQGLALPGLRRRLMLTGPGSEALAQGLAAVLLGWQPLAGPLRGQAPVTRVVSGARSFRVDSDYLDAPMTGLPLAGALCAAIADIAQSWAGEHPGGLALHAAAVHTGAGLVVLAGPHRAGKSTLATRMALEPGWTLWGDDVLPLRPDGQAVALGIRPRLRLPVPDAAGRALRDLATSGCVLGDDRYAYVAVPGQAPHGTLAAPRVLIRLDRRPGATPCLHALPGTEAVRLLEDQSIGGDARTLPRLIRLAAGVVALRLVYDDLEPAAAVLRRALATPQALAALCPDPPVPEAASGDGAEALSPAAMALVWRQMPGLAARRLGKGLALWSPEQGCGLALNPTGAALWRMLAGPVTGWDLAEALAAAFPDVSPIRITADVAAALGAMAATGVLLAGADKAAPDPAP